MTDERISFIQRYEKLPVAVFICDRNDELVEYNPAAGALFDIAPTTGRKDWYPSFEVFDQDGRRIDAVHKPVTSSIKVNPDGHRQEVRFCLPDGTDRHILVSSIATWDDHGDYNGAIHTLSDVTALRDSERQQSLLASIVDSSQDAIITKNLDGRITSWNPAAEKMFGFTAAEAIGSPIDLIIPQDRLAEEKRIINAVSKGKKVEHFETVRLTKTGEEIPISLTISPIINAFGKIIGASKIARDITKQKQAEDELRNYTAHLEEMVALRTSELDHALNNEKELNQLKSHFVSMASHEFRTPLSAVKLSASLIDRYAQNYHDEHIAKHVVKIKNAVVDLTTILGEFLSLEKLESGKVTISLSEFNIEEFCNESVSEMQLLSKNGQKLLYTHEGDSNIVQLDQQLLKHCLQNLLSNAIKYSAENTTVKVKSVVSDCDCTLSVEDQGIGIPEEDQPQLFSAFFRAGNTGQIQGTGLGLNIVARYAGLMNGTVDFKSQANHGTTFTLRFFSFSSDSGV